MSSIINKERLINYTETVRELDNLLTKKENLKEKISALGSVDYSKSKVTNGNKRNMSEQERYAIAMQTLNSRIDELKFWLKAEHEFITSRIAKIRRWEYRKIIVLRYLEKHKWSEIIWEFYWHEPDYEDEKHFKYRDTIMRWHRRALAELEKTNSKEEVPRHLF